MTSGREGTSREREQTEIAAHPPTHAAVSSNWKDGMHALVLSQADGGAVAMDEPTKLLEHEAVLLV